MWEGGDEDLDEHFTVQPPRGIGHPSGHAEILIGMPGTMTGGMAWFSASSTKGAWRWERRYRDGGKA